MMSTARWVALAVMLLVSAACDRGTMISPTASEPSPSAPVSRWPPLTGASLTYHFDRPIGYVTPCCARDTEIRLYDTGGFQMNYLKTGWSYHGSYTVTADVIVFEWDWWSAAGPWGATGTLEGDTLTIRYNQLMGLYDFEDGVYVRVPDVYNTGQSP